MVSDENINDSQTEFRRATVTNKRSQLCCNIVKFHDTDQGKDSTSYTICKSTSSTHPLVNDHIERNKAKESQYGSVRIFDVEFRSRYLSSTSNSFHKDMLNKIRRENNQLVSSCSSIARATEKTNSTVSREQPYTNCERM